MGMINEMKIGVAANGGKAWMGGVLFVELFIRALSRIPRSARPEINFILYDSSFSDLEVFRPSIEYSDKVIYIGTNYESARAIIGDKVLGVQSEAELYRLIDLYFPINSGALADRPAISWIPDFQHCYYPDFFSQTELEARNVQFKSVADYAKQIVVSGKAVKDDLLKFFPPSQAEVHVLQYQLLPEDAWYQQDPVQIQKKYKLPERFMLCCNQFWVHKNHKILLDAVNLLRQKGVDCHVAFTGKTFDYRWPGFFDQLIRYAKNLGIFDLLHILDTVPRDDQIQLLRRCLCIVQPSLFEGLSLIVCEARALGKPIILSDIPVHREQAYGSYFDPANAARLAEIMAEVLFTHNPGPDRAAENQARLEAEIAVDEFAQQCLAMIKKAGKMFGWQDELQGSDSYGSQNTRNTDDLCQTRDATIAASGFTEPWSLMTKKVRSILGLDASGSCQEEGECLAQTVTPFTAFDAQEAGEAKPAAKNIMVATSLVPGNDEVQTAALSSWCKMGFHIVSLNAGDELEILRPLYPDVEFIRVDRDARQQYGRPYVYLDDILHYLGNCEAAICGIINSDVVLRHDSFRQYVEAAAENSIIFGSRLDVSDIQDIDGIEFGGYDYFFFDQALIQCYPAEEFCLGLPWWDYWAVICPMARGYRIQKIITPVAFHQRHARTRNINSFYSLGLKISQYINIPAPNRQTMPRFGRIIKTMLDNRCEKICLPDNRNELPK